MRAALAALASSAAVLCLVSCETAEDVRSGVDQARSSAAAVGSGTRQACQAGEAELSKLGELSTKLADNPDLRVQLAPQVRATVDRLAADVGSRTELQPVVAAARELASSVGEANRSAVELAARQTVLAVRSAEALCKVAG